MLRCGVSKPEEQTIARSLGGLKREVHGKVQVQPYITLNDIVKLSIKVKCYLSQQQDKFQLILLEVEVPKLKIIDEVHFKLKLLIKLQKQKKKNVSSSSSSSSRPSTSRP